MPGIRDIKRRIKSVQSTRKITRAMQLVSAAKMRRAQNAAMQARQYAARIDELTGSLGSATSQSPLAENFPAATHVLVAIVASNRGNVGSLNSNLAPKVREALAMYPGLTPEVVTFGRKANAVTARLGLTSVADFTKAERQVTPEDLYEVVGYVSKLYRTGKYRAVLLIYSKFKSTLSQEPTIERILPVFESTSQATWDDEGEKADQSRFEPGPQQVLDSLLPRTVETKAYQATLEAAASEHSARMVMMKNATDAAGDLISSLQLYYNKLRQNKITTELAEITAGKIALE